MTIASSVPLREDRTSRWVLLVSLGLNLFFIGATGALAARHYLSDPAATSARGERNVAARIERLATTLPAADGDLLRSEYRANAATVEAQRDTFRNAQDEVRAVLRSEPFRPEAMRAAMGRTRMARQAFEQSLQEVIVTAAARMTQAGRNKLADWPTGQRSSETRR